MAPQNITALIANPFSTELHLQEKFFVKDHLKTVAQGGIYEYIDPAVFRFFLKVYDPLNPVYIRSFILDSYSNDKQIITGAPLIGCKVSIQLPHIHNLLVLDKRRQADIPSQDTRAIFYCPCKKEDKKYILHPIIVIKKQTGYALYVMNDDNDNYHKKGSYVYLKKAKVQQV